IGNRPADKQQGDQKADTKESAQPHVRGFASRIVLLRSDENHAGIGATETEGVREGRANLAWLCLLRCEIDVAAIRRILKIEGRRRHLVADSEDREDRLDGT